MGSVKTKQPKAKRIETLTPEQKTFLENIMGPALQNTQAGAEGFQQFLGPNAGQQYKDLANANFKQNTIPEIQNSFGAGSNSKNSSALNQALAAGATNLNTNIAAQTSQNALSAAGGLGAIGTAQTQSFLQPQFGYQQPQQQQQPFWQQALLGAISGGSKIGASFI